MKGCGLYERESGAAVWSGMGENERAKERVSIKNQGHGGEGSSTVWVKLKFGIQVWMLCVGMHQQMTEEER